MQDIVKSTIITFAAGFAIAVVPHIDALTMDSLWDGSLVGLVFAGARTGIKVVIEGFILWYSKK